MFWIEFTLRSGTKVGCYAESAQKAMEELGLWEEIDEVIEIEEEQIEENFEKT